MISTLILAVFFVATPSPQDRLDKAAPFEAVRWEGTTPFIRVDGNWWQWITLDEVLAADIVDHCKKTWPPVWQKRVGEDLVEALAGMGYEPSATVDLTVVDPSSGKRKILSGVAMTREKRQSVWRFNEIQEENHDDPQRLLDRDEALEDLERLRWLIEHYYSYANRLDVDLDELFESCEDSLGKEVPVEELGVAIMKLLARFGDGHTRLAGSARVLGRGYLPAALAWCDGRLVALTPDGAGILDDDHPFLVSIDGVPIERCIDAVRRIAPAGSAQLVAEQTAARLAFLAFVRRELDLPERSTVLLELEDDRGASVEHELRLASRPAASRRYGLAAPRDVSSDGEREAPVGYLRLDRMDSGESFRHSLTEAMASNRDAKAWILDVRGNGGGSREALIELLPYFMGEGDALVVNIAAYRLHEDDDPKDRDGFLANRFLYPAKWSGWNDAEKRAIGAIERKFRPGWTLPRRAFSDWHYQVISTERAKPPFRAEGPVVVLCDAGCFSATDIFLGGFELLPQVTLIGEPSSGGSGRTRTYPLPNSGLEVRLSSMASFRPDGRSYDGRGIEVDVEAPVTLDDLAGEDDSVLGRAIEFLRGELRKG